MFENLFKIFEKKDSLPITDALDSETFLALKDYKNALKSIKSAIKKEPDNDMFLSTEAKVYLAMKKYDDALKSIDKALSIQPDVNIFKDIKEQILQAKK